MVAALVVWLGATAYTAPLCRHPALILERRPAVMLAKKVKKGKEAFVPYEISGDSVPMFPLPARRDAMQAHKKFGDKGVSPSKVPQGALDAHHPTIDLSYPGLRVLHLDPPVLAIDGFFTDEECDAYRALAECTSGDAHRLEQSATFGGTSTARTSTTWFLRLQAVPNLLARVSALLGAPLENFEEPQLVRYQAGQMFSWHYDALPPALCNKNGGQRAATTLVYLNDVPQGGRTAFRDLRAGGTDDEGQPRRVEVAPKKGRALVFFPSFADGTPDERTLHAGEPTPGEKWVAQLWLHHAVYTPNVPEGSNHAAAVPAAREFARERGLREPVYGGSS